MSFILPTRKVGVLHVEFFRTRSQHASYPLFQLKTAENDRELVEVRRHMSEVRKVHGQHIEDLLGFINIRRLIPNSNNTTKKLVDRRR